MHSHGLTAGSILVIASRYYHVPHLMTMHDTLQKKQFLGCRGILIKSLLPIIFNQIDTIHVVSNDASENFLSFMPDYEKQKLIVIPNGIDVELFSGSTKIDFSHHCASSNISLIGFFGRFMSPKGFRYLVDAIEIIAHNGMSKKTPLVLTFGWGGFVREDYLEIENRGLNEYFLMLPSTDNMPGALKGVDMVAMPSLWEACPLLAMEALVAGVPIIGTNCIGLRGILQGSPAVMVTPKDASALAVAIADEMNCSRKSEFEAYAPMAKERFTLDKPSRELKKLYDQMTVSK